MVFQLEEPFKSIYKRAYLRRDSKGRARVDLVIDHKNRTTIAYARYLMCVKVGYIIPKEYDVDHIDRDCSNDSLDNLQILLKSEHLKKTAQEMTTGRDCKELICAYCGKQFVRESRLLRYKRCFCGSSCNGKYYGKRPKLTGDQVNYIKEKFVRHNKDFGIAALARKFGVDKMTVASALYNDNYLRDEK